MDEEYSFWRKIYEDMQTRRIGKSKINQFDSLIKSFEQNGYNQGSVIPVDQNYEILDGSHRLACAALFGANPIVTVHAKSSHSYDREWFIQNGFSEEEIKETDRVRNSLMERYTREPADSFVGVVWGVALEYWDEIMTSFIDLGLRRAFIRDFGKNIESFIGECYRTDGMIQDKIESKAKSLSQKSSVAGIFAVDGSHDQLTDLKKSIRKEISQKMEDYFFDCIIHIIDEKEEGKFILDKFDIKGRAQ